MEPDHPDHDDVEEVGRRLAQMIGLGFGTLLHAIVGVFVISSGLVAPTWAVTALIAAWATAAWAMWRLRHLPLIVLLIPFATFGVWWLAISLGDHLLGWQAQGSAPPVS